VRSMPASRLVRIIAPTRANQRKLAAEGGGADESGHPQVDVLLWLTGEFRSLRLLALGALHKIESEDVGHGNSEVFVGPTGVIQASTAFWPGYRSA